MYIYHYILGHASYSVEIMEKMIEAGMNIACLNMSFGTLQEHIEATTMLRQAAANFSATMGRTYPLAIGIKMSGRKIRTGHIAEVYILPPPMKSAGIAIHIIDVNCKSTIR